MPQQALDRAVARRRSARASARASTRGSCKPVRALAPRSTRVLRVARGRLRAHVDPLARRRQAGSVSARAMHTGSRTYADDHPLWRAGVQCSWDKSTALASGQWGHPWATAGPVSSRPRFTYIEPSAPRAAGSGTALRADRPGRGPAGPRPGPGPRPYPPQGPHHVPVSGGRH